MIRLEPADVGAPVACSVSAMLSYGRAKVASLAATGEWAARLAGSGSSCTPPTRAGPRAARSSLVAAAAPALGEATGQLVAPSGKAGPIPRRAADPALRARVWDDAAAAVGLDPLPREAAAVA